MVRSRRAIVLAAMAAFALLLIFSLVASLAATAASASVPRVRDLVIRSITIDPQTKVATVRGAVTCTGADEATVFVDVSQTVGRLHFENPAPHADGSVHTPVVDRASWLRFEHGLGDVDREQVVLARLEAAEAVGEDGERALDRRLDDDLVADGRCLC